MDKSTEDRLFSIFFPYAVKRLKEARESNIRFVHYTSAATAAQILKNKEFWLREPSCMNDYSEVEHGLRELDTAYTHRPAGENFRSALDKVRPGISSEINKIFINSPFNPRTNVYVGCLSEHKPCDNDFGKLSMWRAYGNGSGVALVLKPQPIIEGPGILKLHTSPVAYFDESTVDEELSNVAQNIEKNLEFLKTLDPKIFLSVILIMLHIAVISIKHRGFEEEREWRLIYSPTLQASPYMQSEVETIAGIPQKIIKVPLGNVGEGISTGAEIPELIEKIIIGPTTYAYPIWAAFVDLLEKNGVSDATKKVHMSLVPLRT